jgi:hypothetical protein
VHEYYIIIFKEVLDMSRRQYNGGRQNGNYNNRNGVGSAGNNGQNGQNNNGGNGQPRYTKVGMVDPSAYGTLSKRVVSKDYTTKDVKNYLQDQAARVDKMISTVLGIEVPATKIEVMSFNMSSNSEKHPFVPFVMTVTTNVLDNAAEYEELPSVFRPSHDDGVHINDAYYDMIFKKFMYDKDDAKCFSNQSWRKQMNIQANFKVLRDIRGLLQPKLQFPEDDRDNISAAKIIVILDPLRIFKAMMYDANNPREKYRAGIKEARRIDGQNFRFRVEREVIENGNRYGDNIEILKEFLARGNSGMA